MPVVKATLKRKKELIFIVKASKKSRKDVRCKVISLQKLPISKSMKEKMAKAGIGFAHLKDVFFRYGSRGILALLAMPQDEI